MATNDTATRQSLLDAAEKLFVERGFNRASVRAITEAAGANVASVNYHFGSKLELIKAVIARRVAPLNAERLQRLAECQGSRDPRLEEVIRAFVEPAVNLPSGGAERETLARLLGMAFSQPGPELRTVLLDLFGPVVDRFTAVLTSILPGSDSQQIFWRFHFMIGALSFTVALGDLAQACSGGLCDPDDSTQVSTELVGFLCAGFRSKTGDGG